MQKSGFHTGWFAGCKDAEEFKSATSVEESVFKNFVANKINDATEYASYKCGDESSLPAADVKEIIDSLTIKLNKNAE